MPPEIEAHAPLARLLEPRGLGRYRGYREMLSAIDRLVARGATVAEVGKSVRGEPLLAVHLGARTISSRTRTTVILSGVHPIEWVGIEAHLSLLDRLASVDLGEREVIAFPIVNPDGVMKVEQNLREGRRRFVRHNARGVDLNRNFDARWHDRGISQRLLPFIFASGKRPSSEPEVSAIAHALSARRIDRAVSLHSFGGAVLYPSAATLWPIRDRAEHHAWAQWIARAADDKPYRATSCARWAMGFTSGGLELDWFHDRHGAVSLLVECSRGGLGIGPSRLFQPFAWFNPPFVEEVAERLAGALMPFARGAKL